jgi:hypothetical protein
MDRIPRIHHFDKVRLVKPDDGQRSRCIRHLSFLYFFAGFGKKVFDRLDRSIDGNRFSRSDPGNRADHGKIVVAEWHVVQKITDGEDIKIHEPRCHHRPDVRDVPDRTL